MNSATAGSATTAAERADASGAANDVQPRVGAARRAYIGIGSNLDSPQRQLRRAVRNLKTLPHSRLRGVSPAYRNPALTARQPEYLNAVAALDSSLAPRALLAALQRIEARQGRSPAAERWAPRPLDLDLLLYGELRIDDPGLQLPHPRMLQRDFVLRPLFDLAPALVLPNGLSLEQALKNLPRRPGRPSLKPGGGAAQTTVAL